MQVRRPGQRHGVYDAAVLDDERERLHRLVRFDVLTAATAVVSIAVTYMFVVRAEWLLVLCLLVGASGCLMALGLRPLAANDLEGTIRWLAAANWSIALAAAAIATFAWPLMALAALLPAMMAPPYVPAERLRWYLVISLAVAVGVATIGLLQDFSGLEDDLPTWVPPAVVISFTPFLAWIVIQTGAQHNSRLQAALAQTQASRARLVAATDRERRRVERDLHDGAQQRLVALGLRLRLAQDQCRRDPDGAAEAIALLRDELHAAQTELRDLAHGVYPPVLTQHGLVEALRAAADRCPRQVDVRAESVGRFSPTVEATVYFCCAEAMQNVVKHAGGDARIQLRVGLDSSRLVFSVADDGVGFDPDLYESGPGGGLENLRDRLGAAGGSLLVDSAPGRGTAVSGSLPADRGYQHDQTGSPGSR